MRICSQSYERIPNANWVGFFIVVCMAVVGCNDSASLPEKQQVEQSARKEEIHQPVREAVVEVSSEQTAATPAATSEVIKVSLADLSRQLWKDAEAVDHEYADKTLEITGRVFYMKPVQGSTSSIVMYAVEESEKKATEPYELVSFILDSDDPWKQVMPGQIVTIETPWSTHSHRGIHQDCKIKSVSGEPPGEYSAEELADQYEMHAEPDLYDAEVKMKFKSQHVIVTGRVKSVECDEQGNFCKVNFETAHKTNLKCEFDMISRTAPQKFEVGQTVRFVGSFDFTMSQKRLIYLGHCIPLEIK
jgi:hypothetical protein